MVFNRPHGVKAEIPEVVKVLAESGYKVLDMNFHDCSNFPTPLQTDDWERWVDEIGNAAAKYGAEFSQSHLHFYEFLTCSEETAKEKEILVDRTIKASSMLGVKWAVTHAASASGPQMRYDSLRGNVAYFQKKLEMAYKCGLSIAIENLWDWNIAPKKRYTSQPDELVELVDALKAPNVGICWDFEHASIMQQDQVSSLRYIGKRLKATHVSDQYGIKADHQIPYFGETDWASFIGVLSEIGYGGDFVYETHRYLQNMPDELVPSALKFSIEVGNYVMALAKNETVRR